MLSQQQQPWESLPNGRSVYEEMRRKFGLIRGDNQPLSTTEVDPNAISITPRPGPAPSRPRSVTTPVYESGAPAPAINNPITPEQTTQTRPAIVGGSLETDPLKRAAARIRTMMEHPTREISVTGEAGPSHPMKRWKAGVLGLLMGMAKAAEGRENPSLAGVLSGGAAGAAIGVAKPRAIQEWRRRNEVEEARGQLSQDQKTAANQANIEGQQAETRQRELAPEIAMVESERKAREDERKAEYEQQRLKIEQDAEEGRKTRAEADRELRRLEGQLNRESREKVAGMRIKPEVDNTPKREAKINEGSALYKKADSIDQGANDLDKQIAELEAKLPPEFVDTRTQKEVDSGAPPKAVQNPAYAPAVARVKALRDKQENWRKEARENRKKGDELRAEGEAIPVSRAAPTTHGFSISGWMKANPGKTKEDAIAFHDNDPKYKAYPVIP